MATTRQGPSRWLYTGFALTLSCAPSANGASVAWRLGSLAGLMQQPTSGYYQLVYGGYGEIARADQKIAFRLAYLERPKFAADGYVDQDFAAFAFLGSRVVGNDSHGLTAYVGAGRETGFIGATDKSNPATTQPQSRYAIAGFATALEYSMQWHGLELAANTQSLIGYVDRDQLQSYVAWPYVFFLMRAGYAW